MYKLNSVILLIAVAAVANGQLQQVDNNNSTFHTDDFINMNRQQHAKVIQDYDTKMDLFEKTFNASLNTISIQLDMLVDSLVQNENKLKSLEVLSDLSKKCVNKYRSSIPTISDTKKKINSCIKSVNSIAYMLNNPLVTRNYLDSYYKNNFESSITSCKKTYSTLPKNYTMCVTKVASETEDYTIKNQQTFGYQMAAAQCSFDANIKKALDCSYTTETNTISAIAEANTMIDRCLQGQDVCQPCNGANTCSEVFYMYRSEINHNSKVMNNPFYRRYNATDFDSGHYVKATSVELAVSLFCKITADGYSIQRYVQIIKLFYQNDCSFRALRSFYGSPNRIISSVVVDKLESTAPVNNEDLLEKDVGQVITVIGEAVDR
ncbi:uncharacterized protein LOC135951894 [Calliphora vicina]|uniref:uncharacterized protein LOC135951894 n=1 Tax=Calliphora vicina TaxID=7373 RepID=UPI00325BED46